MLYNAYVKALKQENDPGYRKFDPKLLDDKDSHQMTFCIKDYRNPKGLSTQVHSLNQDRNTHYEIKGPMGHGLKVKPSGRHFVFAAGTGILCFVDLVASMIHELLKLNVNERNGPNSRSNSSTSPRP